MYNIQFLGYMCNVWDMKVCTCWVQKVGLYHSVDMWTWLWLELTCLD